MGSFVMKKLFLPLVLCMLCAPALADVTPGYAIWSNRQNAIRTYNLTQAHNLTQGGGGFGGGSGGCAIIPTGGTLLVPYDDGKDETPGSFTLDASLLAPTIGNGIGAGIGASFFAPFIGTGNNVLILDPWDKPTGFPELLKVNTHWQEHVTGGWEDGDFNRDGFVDTADLACVTGHWQHTSLSEGGSVETSGLAAVTGNWQYGVTAVPEPSTIVMLILGAISLLVLRRR
jgi:PEP-CTERM motif-containing protein